MIQNKLIKLIKISRLSKNAFLTFQSSFQEFIQSVLVQIKDFSSSNEELYEDKTIKIIKKKYYKHLLMLEMDIS
jgi:predicted Zn-dependent protease with MMP-like domain